jgi:Ni/Fe-hydrogenase subunit HybB-like protein
VLLVEVWSMFTPHPKIHQWACTIAAGIAVCAPATLGLVFAVIGAKPFWFGPFTPVLMIASAFLAGTSLLGIVFYAVHRFQLADHEHAATVALPSVRLLLAVGLAVVSLLVLRQVVMGLASEEVALHEATVALVAGPLAAQFWIVRVGLGLVVPAVLLALPMTRTPAGTGAASLLALVGVFMDRTLFVTAGQIWPRSTAAGTVSYPYAEYSPSPVEIGIILGAVALMAMIYTLVERYVDMGEGDVHVFWPWPWIHRHDDAEVPGEEGAAAGETPTAPDTVAAAAATPGAAS